MCHSGGAIRYRAITFLKTGYFFLCLFFLSLFLRLCVAILCLFLFFPLGICGGLKFKV